MAVGDGSVRPPTADAARDDVFITKYPSRSLPHPPSMLACIRSLEPFQISTCPRRKTHVPKSQHRQVSASPSMSTMYHCPVFVCGRRRRGHEIKHISGASLSISCGKYALITWFLVPVASHFRSVLITAQRADTIRWDTDVPVIFTGATWAPCFLTQTQG